MAMMLGFGLCQVAGAAAVSETNRKLADSSTVARPAPREKEARSNESRATDQASPPISASFGSSGMDECWEKLQAARRPSQVVRLSEACEASFPGGAFAGEMRKLAAGAGKVLEIQHAVGLSGDFFEDSVGNPEYRLNLDKAVRGDKNAAYLVAIAYRIGTSGVGKNLRRMEQWLHISAGLGNGLASWELAEYYNYGGRVADAARFEKRAIDLGYKPAFRLPTRGY
ncbi:MAG: hypothetical protein IPL72_06225 [Sulfuritalea sp.]|nr:hypothetical protein [Sulfuritalea sp.]